MTLSEHKREVIELRICTAQRGERRCTLPGHSLNISPCAPQHGGKAGWASIGLVWSAYYRVGVLSLQIRFLRVGPKLPWLTARRHFGERRGCQVQHGRLSLRRSVVRGLVGRQYNPRDAGSVFGASLSTIAWRFFKP